MSETNAKQLFTRVLVGSVVAFLALLFVGSGIFAYVGAKNMSETPLVVQLTRVFGVPIASVNGDRILYADFIRDKKIIEIYNEQEGGELNDATISDVVLQRLIANTLLVQEAKKFKVTVSAEELDAALDELFAQAPSREEAEKSFMDQFSQFGWDMDDYKKQVLYYTVLQRKLADAAIVLPEGESGVEEVHARHILFLTSAEKATSTVEAAAQAALDRVKAGEDFATVAKELSEDPGSAVDGGDLGWFARGIMVPEFEDAVFALEPGSITDTLVQTAYGFHIIKLEEKRQVRDVEAYFSEVFDSAKIVMKFGVRNPFEQTTALQPEVMVDNQADTQIDISADELQVETIE